MLRFTVFLIAIPLIVGGSACRSRTTYSFALEIRSPQPAGIKGSYSVLNGRGSKCTSRSIQPVNPASDQIRVVARGASMSYHLANEGQEPATVRWVVNGQPTSEVVVPPGGGSASKFGSSGACSQ